MFFRNLDIDPEYPVIILFLLQEGVPAVDSAYTSPFRDLEVLVVDSGSGTYKDLPVSTDISINSPICQDHGTGRAWFPVNLQSYNIQAQRATFDTFTKGTSLPHFNKSMILFEGFTLQGVQAVPADSTAFPHRDDKLIIAPVIGYPGSEFKEEAVVFGESLRRILFEASGQEELHAYLNYAVGSEQLESVFGYEAWRLDRLKALKKNYDPEGRFGFYVPIK